MNGVVDALTTQSTRELGMELKIWEFDVGWSPDVGEGLGNAVSKLYTI